MILHTNDHGVFKLQTSTAEIPENLGVLEMIKPHQALGPQRLLVRVGASDARLRGDQSVIRPQATSLGALICRFRTSG